MCRFRVRGVLSFSGLLGKTLSGFLNEHKGFIMFTTGAVLGLVILLSIVGSVNETANHIISSSGSLVSDCVSECVNTVSTNLECLGSTGIEVGESVNPPPGF